MGSFESKPRQTTAEKLKEFKKELNRAIRELERDYKKKQREEATLRTEMAACLKTNNMAVIRIKAHGLVKQKKSIERSLKLRSQMQSLESLLSEMGANASMVQTLNSATRTMRAMSAGMNISVISDVISKFEAGIAEMSQTQEIVGEALDGALEDGNEAADEQRLIDEVIAEAQALEASKAQPGRSAHAVAAPVQPVRTAIGADGAGGGAGQPPPPAGGGSTGPQPPPAGGAAPPGAGGGNPGGGAAGASAAAAMQARLDKLKGGK